MYTYVLCTVLLVHDIIRKERKKERKKDMYMQYCTVLYYTVQCYTHFYITGCLVLTLRGQCAYTVEDIKKLTFRIRSTIVL